MAIPSLALIPTGFKDGKLYSVLPESGAGDFDVVRGSGATRVNKDGLIEDMRILSGELVTNGDFSTDSNWTLSSGATISNGKANIVGDGTAFTNISQGGVFTSGKQYVVKLDVIINSGLGLKFQDGATNENIGFATTSGTYTFYFTATSNSTLIIARRTSGTAFDSSIDNISVKEVIDDTDIPRLDYTDGGCPSLLLEPQSTNLFTDSNDAAAYNNVSSRFTVTPNAIISPDGTLNATKLEKNTASGTARLRKSGVNTAGVQYTVSVYAKKGSGDQMKLTTGGVNKDFTLTDEWVRYEFTATATSTFSDIAAVSGDAGQSIYIYGAQMEELPYATSYIPTEGAIATRLADKVAGGIDTSISNDSEGVLYVEVASLTEDDTSARYLGMSDGTSSNRVVFLYYSGTNKVRAIVSSGGTKFVDVNFEVSSLSDFHKVAIKYKANDFAMWVDGVEVATDATLDAPIGLDRMAFNLANGNQFFGKVKDLRIYNTALTNAELLTLTTL